MSASGLGRVKTPTCNQRVEIPSRFSQLENQNYLRSLLGEDDRVNNSAHCWLVHVFTQPGSKAEVTARRRHVRFTPTNRRHQPGWLCPLGAQKQTHAPQQVALLFGDQSEICLGRSRCDRRHHDVAGFQRLSHADTQRSGTMPKNGRPRCKR
jgi:hypothetical protein